LQPPMSGSVGTVKGTPFSGREKKKRKRPGLPLGYALPSGGAGRGGSKGFILTLACTKRKKRKKENSAPLNEK